MFGKNYWRDNSFDMQDEDCARGVALYLKSTKHWMKYEEGEYDAPGLWYAGQCPVPNFRGIYRLGGKLLKS